MTRYVLLHHDWPTVHYDLMIEVDGELYTWRLPSPLSPGEQLIERIANHRLEYLNYEGPVSNNRGQVKRFAKGNYVVVQFNQDEYQLNLTGDLQGHINLQRYQPDALARDASRAQNVSAYAAPWLLVWMPS
jgi:hypothetical protein